MKRLLLGGCLLVGLLVGCKDKKIPSMSGNEPVEVTDFIEFFPETTLPFTVADSTLTRKISDSSVIAYSVFSQFVPDSVFKKDFGKARPRIYPLGKVKEKGKETYLFLKAILGTKKAGYLVTFSKKNEYLNTLPIVRPGDGSSSGYGSLDRKFQITTYREKRVKSGPRPFKRNVYIYNSASNDFTLILTEPNEDIIDDVINPIDTLSQRNKYTGDYPANSKNFISVRDGRNASEILFFAHFEKDKGQCTGELKGTARFVSSKIALYRESGNPCTVEFTFTPTAVVMKEVEGCGAYRDIKCFFEGTYPRKKKKSAKAQH